MLLRRIIAWSALLGPLVLAAAAPTAGAAVRSAAGPVAATRTAAVAATQPVLRLGAHGGAVVTLQRRLAALHYFDVGAADGVFGAGTYHAVVAFQKVQRLTRDGVAGQATWSRLARPYVPAPRYRLATTSLEVDLARQVVYYVRNGAVQRIVDSSTGSGAWYYSGGWQPGPLGSMYRPNYFYGGYALHGMTSVPAYPASHGCVRITVPAMDRMWSSLWVGMPLAVYRS
jgi:Putative peptidoglycan binding domain/L,D-transpeptidase catalytic domain